MEEVSRELPSAHRGEPRHAPRRDPGPPQLLRERCGVVHQQDQRLAPPDRIRISFVGYIQKEPEHLPVSVGIDRQMTGEVAGESQSGRQKKFSDHFPAAC